MKRNRFTDEQIIGILKEHEAGTPVSELCRKHGVSDASIYKWKAKFGGMEVSEAKRLKTLEDENTKLKRLLADAMLDNAALKDPLLRTSNAPLAEVAIACGFADQSHFTRVFASVVGATPGNWRRNV
ncbi:transposase [Rhizobium laguerreae]|uniref:transposase n=1 Tax=Rhizobium laguerreae TaxID=1076926 RepID=UPI0030000B27